jgi:diguanylate cyclase (GGDEF)-like protein
MILSAPSIISLVAILVYSALLWVALFWNSRGKVTYTFSLYLVAMIIWSFSSLMIFSSSNDQTTLFWNRFMLIGSIAMPITFLDFTQAFLMRNWRRWLIMGYFAYALVLLADVMGYVIVDARIIQGGLQNQYGAGIFLTTLIWLFFIGYSTVNLIIEYRETRVVTYRNRIKYLLIVIVVIFTGSLTNATNLQTFPVDILFNIASALLIAYALFRHQLLDITIVVRKSLLYAIPTFVISVSYLFLIFLAARIFYTDSGPTMTVLGLIIAIMVTIIMQPLRGRAQLWVDRLFFREKYDSSQMLRRLSQTVVSVLDLDELTHIILTEVTSTMHIQRAGFFLKRGDAGEFYLMAKVGMAANSIRLSAKHPLVTFFSNGNDLLTRIDIDVKPQFHAIWKQEKEELDKIGADLFIPLKTKAKLVGILALGPKLSEELYSQDDQITLTTLANQTAAAIENALLFTIEARRRHEAETLQRVLSELTSDLDLQQVLDNLLIRLENVISYDSASVFLLKNSYLMGVAARGLAKPDEVIGHEFPVENDELFLDLQRSRRPLIIDDASADYRFKGYGATKNVRGWMGIPLIARGAVIGCLTIDSLVPSVYNEIEHAGLAQAFASHAAIAVENARLFAVEREQRELAEALRDIGAVLSTTLDFDNVLDLLLDQIGRVVPYDIANILLVDGGRLRIARTRYDESMPSETALLLKSSTFNISGSPHLYYMLDSAQPLALSMVPPDPDWIESPVPIGSWVGAPVIVKGKVVACFSLSKLDSGYYQHTHAEQLVVFAGQAALALENARLFSEIQLLAIIDDLTGIFNRRHLFELAAREFNRAQRFNRPLSVIMFDLDYFKRVNDTYGHSVGDQVLKVVAERCRANIRDVDVLGRYGGEEFTIILPEAGLDEAQLISERLRKHIARMPITTTAGPIRTTVSVGAACLSGETPNIAKLIDCADFAMYAAKRKGRNLVCVYDEENI